MKPLVVYDSLYGNIKIIVQAIGDAIPGEVERAAARARGIAKDDS